MNRRQKRAGKKTRDLLQLTSSLFSSIRTLSDSAVMRRKGPAYCRSLCYVSQGSKSPLHIDNHNRMAHCSLANASHIHAKDKEPAQKARRAVTPSQSRPNPDGEEPKSNAQEKVKKKRPILRAHQSQFQASGSCGSNSPFCAFSLPFNSYTVRPK